MATIRQLPHPSSPLATPLYAEVRDRFGNVVAKAGDRNWEGYPPDMVARYGQWSVTEWGLQHLEPQYDIPAAQLHTNVVANLAPKSWLGDYTEMMAAVAAARAYHGVPASGAW